MQLSSRHNARLWNYATRKRYFSKGLGPRERRKGKRRRGKERKRKRRRRGEKKGTENKFAGTGETTRARRESVEKRFLAV